MHAFATLSAVRSWSIALPHRPTILGRSYFCASGSTTEKSTPSASSVSSMLRNNRIHSTPHVDLMEWSTLVRNEFINEFACGFLMIGWVCRSAGRWVDGPVGRSFVMCRSVGHRVGRWVGGSVGRLVGWLVGWSVDRWVCGRSVSGRYSAVYLMINTRL
jgi:hypothetical protein